MDSNKRFLTFLLVLPLILCGASAGFAKSSRTKIVNRRWVAKLKQNSWMNRRPFQFATPVLDNEQVYVGVHRGFFYAVGKKRGKKRWTFETKGPVHAEAAVTDSGVIAGDTKGFVYKLGKEKGDLLWQASLHAEILSKPFVREGHVYVVTADKSLFALDEANGQILWSRPVSDRDIGFTMRGTADIVPAGEGMVIGYSDGRLAAHDPRDGRVVWERQLGRRFEEFHDVDATLAVIGSKGYVTTADGAFFLLDPENGEVLQRREGGHVNDIVAGPPYLYMASHGLLYCFRLEDGELLWEQDLDAAELSKPVIYGDWMAVAAAKGPLFFLNRHSGDILYSWHVKGGALGDPILEGKNLYLLSNAARLYRFSFKNGS